MGATPRELLYDRIPFLNRAIGSRRKPSGSANGLLQLGVLRLGFLQDGDVGVGVFPEREEVLICSAGFGASGFCSRTFCGLGFEGVGAGESQAGWRPQECVSRHSAVVYELLKF